MLAASADGPVLETAAGPVLKIRVTPKARKPGILGLRGDAIAVAVAAPPEGGKATAEAVGAIARWLGLKPSSLRLARGAASRDKRLAVEGYTAVDLRKRVARALAEGGFGTG